MKKDFYEVLGVDKSSSKEEIKSAYRKMALKHHPDRNKEADSEEKFKEINEAYEVLSNDKKKEAYDQYGHAAFDPSAGGFGGRTYTDQSGPFTYTWNSGGQNASNNADFSFGGFSNPFDIFEQFFGSSFSQSRAPRLETYRVQLSFMEAAKGTEKEFNINGKNKKVKIPAGVNDGQRIRFQDFILYIDVQAHPQFKRDDDDIFITVPITITQAILGDSIQVETLDGPLKVKVQPGTQSHTLIRLKGKGINNVQGYGKGDFYIRLIVNIPQKLNFQQKLLLKELKL